VSGGATIGEGRSRIYANHDSTAHGEIETIRDACRQVGARDLSGAAFYTTGGHPCPMCAMARYWAGRARPFRQRPQFHQRCRRARLR